MQMQDAVRAALHHLEEQVLVRPSHRVQVGGRLDQVVVVGVRIGTSSLTIASITAECTTSSDPIDAWNQLAYPPFFRSRRLMCPGGQ
jgi:hypothetical protein